MTATVLSPKPKPLVLRFYVDDSGSRDPNRALLGHGQVDWFGLGGVIVRESDVPAIDAAVAEFRARWPHPDAPLHSYEIRQQKHGFGWLKKTGQSTRNQFLGELSDVMKALPILVHATVVDRPGYNKRYLEPYGPRRKEGLPFDASKSARYQPLCLDDLAATLLEFDVKTKKSIPMQIADLGLWPVCKGRYEPNNRALQMLVESGKLLDCCCTTENGLLGIKYSCFD